MACSAHSWKHITHAQIHMRKTAITSSHSLQTRGSQPVHLPSLCGSESSTWWSWVVVPNPSVWYGLSCVRLSTLRTYVIPVGAGGQAIRTNFRDTAFRALPYATRGSLAAAFRSVRVQCALSGMQGSICCPLSA
jgi:hypothetical protein